MGLNEVMLTRHETDCPMPVGHIQSGREFQAFKWLSGNRAFLTWSVMISLSGRCATLSVKTLIQKRQWSALWIYRLDCGEKISTSEERRFLGFRDGFPGEMSPEKSPSISIAYSECLRAISSICRVCSAATRQRALLCPFDAPDSSNWDLLVSSRREKWALFAE